MLLILDIHAFVSMQHFFFVHTFCGSSNDYNDNCKLVKVVMIKITIPMSVYITDMHVPAKLGGRDCDKRHTRKICTPYDKTTRVSFQPSKSKLYITLQ